MKKILTLLLVAAVSMAFGQITGTAHDFSGETAWNSSGEICITCHTPHAASADAPLWNHEMTAGSFTMYSNPSTIDGTIDGTPGGDSKLCLSCHDGTVAIDNFGGNTGGTVLATSGALIGEDLSNDHPVSIVYNSTADNGLNSAGSVTGISQGDKLECSTCHDVHDDTHGSFLVMSNATSGLCLDCHNK